MKFTLNSLSSCINIYDDQQIANSLTNIGLEVENIIDYNKILKPFIVAEIITAEPHHDADKLKICQVRHDQSDELLQIVCGAKNARAGLKTVLAPVGVTMPCDDSFKIKPSKIRGVTSNGMLCAFEELGLLAEDGIIELAEDAIVGTPCAKYLGYDDVVYEIAITPNRGDCFGIYNIARDLAAAGCGELLAKSQLEVDGKTKVVTNPYQIIITDQAKQACSYFTTRYLANTASCQRKSTAKMQKFFRLSGLKSINEAVDITNYSAYMYNQPLHVFDADKIIGDTITISLSKGGEKFIALDDVEYILPQDAIIISDAKGIISLAGIIGGKRTAVDNNTKNILLEAAHFDPASIMKTGRKTNIISDARTRFERGVDISCIKQNLDHATMLMTTLDDDSTLISEMASAGSDEGYNQISPIAISTNDVKKITNLDICGEELKRILASLGFMETNDGYIPPSWRYDVTIKEDLVEEIIRIKGINQIPSVELPAITNDHYQDPLSHIRQLLAHNNCYEHYSWSFCHEERFKLFSHDDNGDATQTKPNHIANPISNALSVMRPSIIATMLDAVQKNFQQQQSSGALYEIAPIFFDGCRQEQSLGVMQWGEIGNNDWNEQATAVDVYSSKKLLYSILQFTSLDLKKLRLTTDALPAGYHPFRSGKVMLGKQIIAIFGEVHPTLLTELKIKTNVCACEIFLDRLPNLYANNKGKPQQQAFSAIIYPQVKRDLSFIFANDIDYADIIRFITNIDRKIVREINLNDHYIDDKLAKENKKSLSFSFTLRDNNKTLEEEDINNVMSTIITKVENKFSASLRDC